MPQWEDLESPIAALEQQKTSRKRVIWEGQNTRFSMDCSIPALEQ
jgi:hypothetical protein